MVEPCTIELFGLLQVRRGERLITRFSTAKTAALLAYLAYHRHRSHTREALVELLWPECDLDTGRNRLSTALSSLRNQLERPGGAPGSVLVTDRSSVGLNARTVTTDVEGFESALETVARAPSDAERQIRLREAVDLYHGEFLMWPGRRLGDGSAAAHRGALVPCGL